MNRIDVDEVRTQWEKGLEVLSDEYSIVDPVFDNKGEPSIYLSDFDDCDDYPYNVPLPLAKLWQLQWNPQFVVEHLRMGWLYGVEEAIVVRKCESNGDLIVIQWRDKDED